MPVRAGPVLSGPGRAGPGRAGPGRAGPGRPASAGLGRPIKSVVEFIVYDYVITINPSCGPSWVCVYQYVSLCFLLNNGSLFLCP